MYFSPDPHLFHALSISSFFISSPLSYLTKSTSLHVPHKEVSFIRLSLPPSKSKYFPQHLFNNNNNNLSLCYFLNINKTSKQKMFRRICRVGRGIYFCGHVMRFDRKLVKYEKTWVIYVIQQDTQCLVIEFIHNTLWLDMIRTSMVHPQERLQAVCCRFGMW